MMKNTKALSIRQPYVELILHYGKDVENRTWSPRYRGALFLHASQTCDRKTARIFEFTEEEILSMPLGAIVGAVDLIDVVKKSDSPWHSSGCYGLVLANPRALKKPVPCKGKLNLWTIPEKIEEEIHEIRFIKTVNRDRGK